MARGAERASKRSRRVIAFIRIVSTLAAVKPLPSNRSFGVHPLGCQSRRNTLKRGHQTAPGGYGAQSAHKVRGILSSFLMLLACVTAGAFPAFAQSDWHDPFPPHRIADHLYYVGSKGLASYLITTTNGHILINSSFERTVPILRTNIEALGFKFTDIKILLTSHAHSDHASGHALIKKLTGARVEVMEGDAQVIVNGGKGQYLYTEDDAWKPCAVDRVLKDGDMVALGEARLTARLTPGHTRGCTTWLMQTTDGGKTWNVVIVGSPNVNPGYALITNRDYPEIADDYTKTFRLLKALPCDIFLGAHGSYYGMEAKYVRLQKDPKTNPFIDREGYRAYVDDRAQAFREAVLKQR